MAADLAEKTSGVRYPVVYVYCEKVVNDLREKFRTFSGTADLCVDIRVSHEHMDELQASLQTYVEAVTDVLDKKRGQWATGVFYTRRLRNRVRSHQARRPELHPVCQGRTNSQRKCGVSEQNVLLHIIK